MVDVGSDGARVFLDDLQQVDHGLTAGPEIPGGEIMCLSMSLPHRVRGGLTKVEGPPLDLPAPWSDKVAALVDLKLQGMWAVIWDAIGVQGVLYVNEDRWRGGCGTAAAQAVSELGAPTAWAGVRRVVAESGLVAYPDSIEVHRHGYDVTVGAFAVSEGPLVETG